MNISDYAFLSDCQSAALVGKNGSIDWYCTPRFDSPSTFSGLLDEKAGHWFIRPSGKFSSVRSYAGDSLVLKQVFSTKTGSVCLTDALMLDPGAKGHEIGKSVPHVLLRSVEGLAGAVDMEMELVPRFEYGLVHPRFERSDHGWDVAGGAYSLHFGTTLDVVCSHGCLHVRFTLRAGDRAGFSLAFKGSYCGTPMLNVDVQAALEDTTCSWHSWSDMHTGYQGLFREEVRRSSLTLQGLTFQPSGAIVAAATTSLPEVPAGEWNWDYRFAWLRDASLVMRAAWIGACPDEPERFFQWIDRSCGAQLREDVQIMYGVEGERDLTEHYLDHLSGFCHSRPVRVGNDAWKQRQLDVMGEVLDAAHLLQSRIVHFDRGTRFLLVSLADMAAFGWKEPDSGMWELRDKERHYLSSKLMCWVALSRAISMAQSLDAEEEALVRWTLAKAQIERAILTEGWSDRAHAFTGSFGSDELDASVLLMPIMGFIEATDPRMKATIEAIDSRLSEDGLVRRWEGEYGAFVLCSYWMVECLALAGEHERAAERFGKITGYANDVGLISEEIDPSNGDMIGNFPQAFSHIGLINAAWQLTTTSLSEGHAPA